MGASLLTPHCPQACTRLQLPVHCQVCGCALAPALPGGISSTRHFGLWVLDSPRKGSDSAAQPLQQFHWAQQEAFPSSRARISSLEKCQVPSYSSPHPGLYLQVGHTTSLLYSVSWGCTLGLLKGDFGETFEVGFRSSSWGHCQYYFLMGGYDHEDD